MRIRSLTLGALVAAGLVLGACGSSSKSSTPVTTTKAAASATTAGAAMVDKDIVDTAVAAGSFNTLASLLTKAGLVDTLKGAGPFTVFAPTDEAFAKVDKATLDKLGANVDALKQVLTYHVVGGKVMIDKATVTKTDIAAKNGVIHVIDTVLIPADLKL